MPTILDEEHPDHNSEKASAKDSANEESEKNSALGNPESMKDSTVVSKKHSRADVTTI